MKPSKNERKKYWRICSIWFHKAYKFRSGNVCVLCWCLCSIGHWVNVFVLLSGALCITSLLFTHSSMDVMSKCVCIHFLSILRISPSIHCYPRLNQNVHATYRHCISCCHCKLQTKRKRQSDKRKIIGQISWKSD